MPLQVNVEAETPGPAMEIYELLMDTTKPVYLSVGGKLIKLHIMEIDIHQNTHEMVHGAGPASQIVSSGHNISATFKAGEIHG